MTAEEAGKKVTWEAQISCSIDALTVWLCGVEPLEELVRQGRITGNEAGLAAAGKLRPLQGVHLPEEV